MFAIAVGAIAAALAVLILWPWDRDGGDRTASEEAEDGGSSADDEGLPEEISREEVRDILRKLAPLVALCGKGEGGVVRVHLEIWGPKGTVKSATVAKQFADTPVARCAVGVVESAQFPRFRKKSLTVVFPYTLPEAAPADGGAGDGDSAGAAGSEGGPAAEGDR